MADFSSHPDFDLDVALSADLDGELDAYASDLGVAPADLRAAVDDPAVASRRAELAAVRGAVGAEPDPSDVLDDVTRRRLLAGAGPDQARRAPDRSWILRAGAAAAITLVVVGALYAVTRNSGDSGAKSSASRSADRGGATAAVTGDLGNVGAINAAGIGRLLRGQAPVKDAASAPAGPEFAQDTKRAASGASGNPTSSSSVALAPQAVEACAKQYGTEGTIRFRAAGTYQGRAAVVLGIDTDRRTIVFVVAADNCAQVLYSASR